MNGIEKLQEIAKEFWFDCKVVEEGDKVTVLAYGFPQVAATVKRDGEELQEFRIMKVSSEQYIPLGGVRAGDAVGFERFVSILEIARDKANFAWNVETKQKKRNGNDEIGIF